MYTKDKKIILSIVYIINGSLCVFDSYSVVLRKKKKRKFQIKLTIKMVNNVGRKESNNRGENSVKEKKESTESLLWWFATCVLIFVVYVFVCHDWYEFA